MPLFALKLLFCQDACKSTLRRKNNFPNKCVRTYVRHDICTHLPKPPSSACCTSHAHTPTRPSVHRTMPSTRHISLTSQLTNKSLAHMQPGIHQSRPPPNVLRSSHYHHNSNTLTSQLKHPAHMQPIPYQSHPSPTSLVVDKKESCRTQYLTMTGVISMVKYGIRYQCSRGAVLYGAPPPYYGTVW